jgi:hypothetical protein
MIDESNKVQTSSDKAEYEQRLKEFTERYPADVNALVRGRLTEFLDLTADIDYSAKLVKNGDKMGFADKSLERKPGNWKYCFRAGQPAVVAARAFAQSWLQELQ